jgi:RNA polymerase sigma factor (sigma-70 family)
MTFPHEELSPLNNPGSEIEVLVSSPCTPQDDPLAQSLPLTEKQRHRQDLDRVVIEVLLADDEEDLHKILPFIRWKLKSFGLTHLYETRDVFLESYDRAIAAIEAGKALTNIPAWFKSTSFRVISEYARKEKRLATESLGDRDLSDEASFGAIDEELEMRSQWLLELLNQVSPEDRKILWLRMSGKSYKQIAEQLGGREEALRQRVSRILKRLRKLNP